MSAMRAIRAEAGRHFEASAERVFEAWLKPDLIERWMFGPTVRDEEIVHLSVDPRLGGAFSFMVERDGQKIEHLGKYLEFERPRRLVFTWMVAAESVGSRVLVEIAPRGEGCELRLVHEVHPSWAAQVAQISASWQRMLEGLAAALQ